VADLQIIEIQLHNLDGPLPIQAVRLTALRGLFFGALGGEHSAAANTIHEISTKVKNRPAPYSISLITNKGTVVGVRVATFEDRTAGTQSAIGEIITEKWGGLIGKEGEVQLGSARMTGESINTDRAADLTYAQLWEQSKPRHELKLHFVTPTRILSHGHPGVLPVPFGVWQFYVLRWSAFSPIALPPEFQTWVLHQVQALEANLETRYASIEGQERLSGVVGIVRYGAYQEKNRKVKESIDVFPESRLPEYLRAWQALAKFAEYCGTGENANIGMGQTRLI